MAADRVDKDTRSRIMACVKGKNTTPELILRKGLFAKGLRYRLHEDKMPGKPDLIFPKYRAAIFVNGCYWHGHDCSHFRMPSSNVEYWTKKINRNRENDERSRCALIALGWRVKVVWECSLIGKDADINTILDSVVAWIISADSHL